MHTGEEWFAFGWQQYAVLATVLAVYLLLVFKGKLPSMQSFKDFADTVNSAGGHIILLGIFSAWSIKIAMQFFFHILALPTEQISKSDAITTAGIAFVTGNLCGTFISALIKTMSGGKANGNGTTPTPDATNLPAPLPAQNVAANPKEVA